MTTLAFFHYPFYIIILVSKSAQNNPKTEFYTLKYLACVELSWIQSLKSLQPEEDARNCLRQFQVTYVDAKFKIIAKVTDLEIVQALNHPFTFMSS